MPSSHTMIWPLCYCQSCLLLYHLHPLLPLPPLFPPHLILHPHLHHHLRARHHHRWRQIKTKAQWRWLTCKGLWYLTITPVTALHYLLYIIKKYINVTISCVFAFKWQRPVQLLDYLRDPRTSAMFILSIESMRALQPSSPRQLPDKNKTRLFFSFSTFIKGKAISSSWNVWHNKRNTWKERTI